MTFYQRCKCVGLYRQEVNLFTAAAWGFMWPLEGGVSHSAGQCLFHRQFCLEVTSTFGSSFSGPFNWALFFFPKCHSCVYLGSELCVPVSVRFHILIQTQMYFHPDNQKLNVFLTWMIPIGEYGKASKAHLHYYRWKQPLMKGVSVFWFWHKLIQIFITRKKLKDHED